MIEWAAEWADYLGGLDELLPVGVAADPDRGRSRDLGFGARGVLRAVRDRPAVTGATGPAGRRRRGGGLHPDVAEPASFDADPDTAEVSVVEDPVIGDNPPGDDEESYVVPPGISPFTGQPIVDPSTPGTYLPENVSSPGLPTSHAYDPTLPSSEPPRVGGGVDEGDDFYNSLFADAPASARLRRIRTGRRRNSRPGPIRKRPARTTRSLSPHRTRLGAGPPGSTANGWKTPARHRRNPLRSRTWRTTTHPLPRSRQCWTRPRRPRKTNRRPSPARPRSPPHPHPPPSRRPR